MEENVKEIGNLFVVDPNPPGGSGLEQIPPEDLFIYVKFTARPRSRQVFAGTDENGISKVSPSGVEDEVNFISTEIKYTPDGKIETPEGKETVDSFATTNWTGIGGLGTSSSGGLLEGFGMKSIDIKYNASLVPEVNITFTDVRGSGLFDVIKDNDRLSPYSLFFKMPYPIFTLSVKGYFGQTVEYCLHMTNWISNFDGSTGNFDISANFLGFQQAFLNDMVIGNIIANVQTEVGITQLNNLDWTYEDDDGETITIKEDIRKLDDFFLQISRLQINVESIKSNSTELDELKDLNGQLSLLKQIRTFIGTPIIKSKTDLDDKEVGYLNMKNTEKEWVTTGINDNILELNDNYLSVRDYLIINSINIAAYKSYIVTLTDIINQYKDYFINQEITPTDANTEFESSFSTEEDSYMYYVNPSTIDNGGISFKKLEDILVSMSTANDNLYLRYDYNVKSGKNNKDFKIEDFQKGINTLYNGKLLSKDSECFVVDFRKQRATLENLYNSLIKDIKIKTKNTNDKLNSEITKNLKSKFGFNPTIENCFRILTNNTQAMISSIHEITKQSSGKLLAEGRKDILKKYDTDIPGEDEFDASIAWPAVYRKNDDDTPEEEIYLGEIEDNAGVNNYFPEKVYVDSIFEAAVAREKALQEVTRSTKGAGLDTDNWFPINPIDYDVNPYTELNFSSDEPAMYNVLANRIFLRVAVLKNYSLFEDGSTGGNFTDYASMDGISANLTIFGEKTRGVIDNILEKLVADNTSLHNTKFYKDNVVLSGSEYTIKDNNKIGDIEIGGRDSGVDFIQFDTPGIINNVPSLPDQITENTGYVAITNKKDNRINKYIHDTEYIKQIYKNGNLVSEIQYNVWDKDVSSNLYKRDSNNKLDVYKVTKISDIDISGTTGGKYFNKTNFFSDPKTKCGFEESMIESDLYQNQTTNKAKALLLLSTLPFRRFKEAVLDVVFPGEVYSGARIIKLPEYYIYFIGAYLWNYENDGIKWDINFSENTDCSYNEFETGKNLYLTKLGYMTTTADKGKEKEIESELLKLPKTTKDKIIKKFEQWATSGNFIMFETNIMKYTTDANSGVSTDAGKKAIEKLIQAFNQVTDMIVFTPKIFDQTNPLPTKLTVTEDDIKSYIKSLSNKFTKTNETNINKSRKESDIENNEKHNNKLKLAIYKYFKNINDKWVAGIDSGKSFNVCGSSSINNDKNLIDYFKFIDRGWSDIGQKAVFNLNSFLTLSSNFKTSVYFFMSKLLRDSNFLFQILPTYINFKDSKEVAKMFKPITTIENNQSSGPMYACIYIGGASKVLDIKERKNYYFRDDGFSFPNPSVKNDIGTVPPGFATKSGDFSQVAFRVAFGAENQTIFKNVSLNQQEHKETAEYFAALSDIIDKRGGTQKTYVGTDLYKLYDARSYTCKVDALGCMNIQPLMYFDLQNVPFFKGAYLITSVNHNITPNHMTTNFQGVRQSKLIVPPPTDITVDLGLDLGESTKIPKLEFINLQNNSGKFVIGVLNPNDAFDFTKFTIDNFKLMCVSIVENNGSFSGDLGSEPQLVIDDFKEQLKTNLITTNKQVCMIMGNIMTVSNNMSNKTKNPEPSTTEPLEFDNTTIYSGQPAFYDINPNTDVKSPFYDDFKNIQQDSERGITPTFTAHTTSIDIEKYKARGEGTHLKILDGDKYGNLYNSDADFFAPRGYLYVKGRKEFYEMSKKFTINTFIAPFDVAKTAQGAFNVAVYVWTTFEKGPKGKTAFEIVKDGNGGANSYSATVEIVNDGVNTLEESFESFDNVLRTFNLHNDFFI